MTDMNRLLEKPCHIIDFLPRQVPKDCGGQFFKVEKYSLQGTTQGRYLTGGVPPVRFSM